jgi:ribosomal protein L11 methyltransferase
MGRTWKVTCVARRAQIEAALVAHEEASGWETEIVLAGTELGEDRPEDWRLEAWLPRVPSKADLARLRALFGASRAPKLTVEALPDADWLSLSQQGVDPIRAGRFHVRTPNHPPPDDAGYRDFVIPAAQAFGTGQHATTGGCLGMLTAMRRRGVVVRNFADIGTGTGLLAFATLDLWPGALATASDIDAVCAGVVEENAAANGITPGARRGELTMVIADGMDHPLLAARGPYDLIIANILAGPLTAMARDFAEALVPGGQLLLAGLLDSQEERIRRVYRRAGFRLAARIGDGEWPVLWLRRRASYA